MKLMSLVSILFLVCMVFLMGCNADTQKTPVKTQINKEIPTDNTKPTVTATPVKNLNPNTGNLWTDIKVRLEEVLK